jgi:hypothetical protein
MYADDADFLVHDDAAVSQIIEIVSNCFGPFNLCLNESKKTEITKLDEMCPNLIPHPN